MLCHVHAFSTQRWWFFLSTLGCLEMGAFFHQFTNARAFSSPEIGAIPGWVATLWLVLVTGFLGGSLAHRQGFAVWRQIQENLARGQLPGLALMEGLMILVAGLVLITLSADGCFGFSFTRADPSSTFGTAVFESLCSFSGNQVPSGKKRPPVCALCRGERGGRHRC